MSEEKAPIKQQALAFRRKITRIVGGKYLLSVPKNYRERRALWPLILFLHGMGERGDDLELVRLHGPPKIVEQNEDFPFILVSPQCPADGWWSPDVLNALLDQVIRKYRVDPDRIYLTGLSMGGAATWELAAAYPQRFAAIAPISGVGRPDIPPKIVHIPVWAFHGAKDDLIPVTEAEKMVNALKELGADAKLTVYPEAEHDAWTEAYDDSQLYEWFLSHRRQR